MNILVIGAGKDPKRFGTFFVNTAKEQHHTVQTFSYRLDQETPEYYSKKFSEEIESIDKIDILLYNCIGGFYPGNVNDYSSTHSVNFKEWQNGIMINAAMPHMFATKCLEKMDDNSSIVFMTSSASYLINRDNYLDMAGYFGTKGAMNHLMRALSTYNDKNATVCTFGPHIPYENPEEAEKVMSALTDRILNLSKEDNGKILQCYPPEANIFYHEGGKNA